MCVRRRSSRSPDPHPMYHSTSFCFAFCHFVHNGILSVCCGYAFCAMDVLPLQIRVMTFWALLTRKMFVLLLFTYMCALFRDVMDLFVYFTVADAATSSAQVAAVVWSLLLLFFVPVALAQGLMDEALEDVSLVLVVALFAVGVGGVVFVLYLMSRVAVWARCPTLVNAWWSSSLPFEWTHLACVVLAGVIFIVLSYDGTRSVVGAYYRHALRRAFFHPSQLDMRFGEIPVEAPYFICNTAMSGNTLEPFTAADAAAAAASQTGEVDARLDAKKKADHLSYTERSYIHRTTASFAITPLYYGNPFSRYHRCAPAISPKLVDGMGSSGAAIGVNMGYASRCTHR
jgi:hypothetical protein